MLINLSDGAVPGFSTCQYAFCKANLSTETKIGTSILNTARLYLKFQRTYCKYELFRNRKLPGFIILQQIPIVTPLCLNERLFPFGCSVNLRSLCIYLCPQYTVGFAISRQTLQFRLQQTKLPMRTLKIKWTFYHNVSTIIIGLHISTIAFYMSIILFIFA